MSKPRGMFIQLQAHALWVEPNSDLEGLLLEFVALHCWLKREKDDESLRAKIETKLQQIESLLVKLEEERRIQQLKPGEYCQFFGK